MDVVNGKEDLHTRFNGHIIHNTFFIAKTKCPVESEDSNLKVQS